MPKVSFRMASVSRESVFGVQTSTARKNRRSGHTDGRFLVTVWLGVATAPLDGGAFSAGRLEKRRPLLLRRKDPGGLNRDAQRPCPESALPRCDPWRERTKERLEEDSACPNPHPHLS